MSSGPTLRGVTIDCPDAKSLADFYHNLAGWEVTWAQDEFASLSTGDGSPALYLQRVEDYESPQWPGQQRGQQFHLDFAVDDISAAEKQAISLGAARPDFQPGEDRWRVLLDPAGHPFCLSQR